MAIVIIVVVLIVVMAVLLVSIGMTFHGDNTIVGAHAGNILTKLHLANRVQATLYALREGIASLDAE